jgi:hypothetical protein
MFWLTGHDAGDCGVSTLVHQSGRQDPYLRIDQRDATDWA